MTGQNDDSQILAVVVSKLEDVTRQLSLLVAQFTKFTTDFPQQIESTYLRKETYNVKQLAVDKALKDLEDANDEQAKDQRANRRLAWSAVAAPILVALVLYVLIGAQR